MDDASQLPSKLSFYLMPIFIMYHGSNASFHLLMKCKFCLPHICFNKFLLILHLNSLKIKSFFKAMDHFLLINIVINKNQPALMKIFPLLQYPILSSNNYFPFSIKAIFLIILIHILNHQNNNHDYLLQDIWVNLLYDFYYEINL